MDDPDQQPLPISRPEATRYHGLDALRAIMMTLGVVIHSAISYIATPGDAYWPYKDRATSPVCDLLVAWIHGFRMPLFFVLAGFFAALLADRRGMAGLIRNRLKRILVPFVVAMIILTPLVGWAFLFTWSWSQYKTPDQIATEFNQGQYQSIQTMHLWFLYQLLYFYATAAILVPVARKLPDRWRGRFLAGFRRMVENPWVRPFALGLLTMLTVLTNRIGVIDTSISLIPDPAILLTNGLFFGFGWLFYGCRDLLPTWKRLAWTQVLLATFVVIPIQLTALVLLVSRGDSVRPAAWLVSAGATGLQSWLLIFGITGLFLRYADFETRPIRYLTDASYWVYLAHLPLVILLAGLLAPLPWPALVKMPTVVVIAMGLLLVSYHFLIRPTFLGEWLNGVRYPIGRRRPALPTAAEPAVS